MSLPLTLKYRPRNFSDLVGNSIVRKILKNTIRKDLVKNAYFFEGGRGSGKTTTVRIFSRAVNCESPVDGEPCNTCDSCVASINESNPDILEVDAASENSVERVKSIVRAVHYMPVMSKKRIVILDEVHCLSKAAGNALLKTLEEPPDHVVFMFCTTDPQLVLDTVLSRCLRFQFQSLPVKDIADRLLYIAKSENIDLQRGAAEAIAASTQGALRDAITILDQASQLGEQITEDIISEIVGHVSLEHCADFVDAIGKGDVNSAFRWAWNLLSESRSELDILRALLKVLTQVIFVQQGVMLDTISESANDYLKSIASKLSLDRLLTTVRAMKAAQSDIRRGGEQKSALALAIGIAATGGTDTSFGMKSLVELSKGVSSDDDMETFSLIRKYFDGSLFELRGIKDENS